MPHGKMKSIHFPFIICHFSFVIREFNLEVQQLLFEKYFIWRLETEALAGTIV